MNVFLLNLCVSEFHKLEQYAHNHLFLFPSAITQSTSSNRQFVHGAPNSITLHLTFRARQHRHAFGARRLLLLGGRSVRSASTQDRFKVVAISRGVLSLFFFTVEQGRTGG